MKDHLTTNQLLVFWYQESTCFFLSFLTLYWGRHARLLCWPASFEDQTALLGSDVEKYFCWFPALRKTQREFWELLVICFYVVGNFLLFFFLLVSFWKDSFPIDYKKLVGKVGRCNCCLVVHSKVPLPFAT